MRGSAGGLRRIRCAVSARVFSTQVEDLKRDLATANADLQRALAERAAAGSEVKELVDHVRYFARHCARRGAVCHTCTLCLCV
jgi:hypothetical protein